MRNITFDVIFIEIWHYFLLLLDSIIFCSHFLRSKDSLQAKENSKVANGGGDYATEFKALSLHFASGLVIA